MGKVHNEVLVSCTSEGSYSELNSSQIDKLGNWCLMDKWGA